MYDDVLHVKEIFLKKADSIVLNYYHLISIGSS